MNQLVSAQQMRDIERKTFSLGLLSIAVMENAAAAVAGRIAERFSQSATVCVACGKGNNGGDGFAIARHLFFRGYKVTVLMVFPQPSTPDAKTNFEILQKTGVPITADMSVLDTCDVIVDAVLGIGIRGDVELPVVERINRSAAFVLAVDIPTGICSDRGIVCKNAVKADMTVTFGFKKTGLCLYPGAAYAGEVVVADISLVRENGFRCYEPDAAWVASLMPQTARDANKGNRGRVFVIAGSPGLTGAATMVCGGALRCGSGLVTLAVPRDMNAIMEVKLTEAMTLPLPCEQYVTADAIRSCMDKILSSDCVVVGPGLGKNAEIFEIIALLLENNVPLIIDADGINALQSNIDILMGRRAPVVLTPHPGEFARLRGCSIEEVQNDRLAAARDFAKEYQVVLALKGAGTVIALPDGNCYINPTGNPGMAVGGSGDVLSGMIGALVGRGMSVGHGCIAGVYLHGLAGDLVRDALGEDGMLPSDLIEAVPAAIQKIKKSGTIG